MCAVVLPSSGFLFFVFNFVVQDVGEIHRVVILLYSRSPLSELKHYKKLPVNRLKCRGDSQGRTENSTLVLPSLNRNTTFEGIFLPIYSDAGENHRGVFLINSRSPICGF